MKNIWQGKIVRLRSPRLEDAENLFMVAPPDTEADAFSDHTNLPYVQTVEQNQKDIQAYLDTNAGEKDDDCKLVIETLEGNRPVGTVGIHESDRRFRNAWLDVWLSTNERGKGYGGEAILILLNYFFNELDYYRIALDVYEMNEKAIQLYKKLGFSEEGRLRQHVFYRGRRWDEVIMGILKDEFNSKHPEYIDFLYSDH
jgi:RimJ/RimL family protein N-acetyltransferase